MAHGNLALARDYFAEIRTYEERLATLMSLDVALIRLYGMRGKPDAEGAMSHNRRGYISITYQRYALDLLFYGVANNDINSIKRAIMGFRYGFRKQEQDGSFEVSFLSRRRTDVGRRLSHACLFTGAAAIGYQILYHSPYRNRFLKPLAEMRMGIKRSVLWLAKNDVKLFIHDQDSAYHLINNALTFIVCGEIFKNVTLIKRGHIFLDIALELQRDDGAFMEYEGHDSSYQASNIIMLMYYLLFVHNRKYFVKVIKSIAMGLVWEKSRIMPTGKVNAKQNTRRVETYSTFSGRKSDINYSEVVKAFLWYSYFTEDTQSRALAKKVFQFIARQSSPTTTITG